MAYTAPHWPLQAPEAAIAKYRERYLAGWDAIRTNRYQRQIQLRITDRKWPLTPRDSRVPPWEEVRDKEREANRMATYAAMVERMDHGAGRILDELTKKGITEDTLVIFFPDNGACDKAVQPGCYDVPSRTRDGRPVKAGNGNKSIFAGPADVWQSYGPSWANACDTPFRLYKHFTHEGGVATPFIACWPAKIKPGSVAKTQIGPVTDIMATFVEVAEVSHPKTYAGHSVQPLEGVSLVPIVEGKAFVRPQPLFWEHEGNRAIPGGARHGLAIGGECEIGNFILMIVEH